MARILFAGKMNKIFHALRDEIGSPNFYIGISSDYLPSTYSGIPENVEGIRRKDHPRAQTVGFARSLQPCLLWNRSGLRAGAWERTKSRRGRACCARLPWARSATYPLHPLPLRHCDRREESNSAKYKIFLAVSFIKTTEIQYDQGKNRHAGGTPARVRSHAGAWERSARASNARPHPNVRVRLRLATTAQTEGPQPVPEPFFCGKERNFFYFFCHFSMLLLKVVPVFWKNWRWRG